MIPTMPIYIHDYALSLTNPAGSPMGPHWVPTGPHWLGPYWAVTGLPLDTCHMSEIAWDFSPNCNFFFSTCISISELMFF